MTMGIDSGNYIDGQLILIVGSRRSWGKKTTPSRCCRSSVKYNTGVRPPAGIRVGEKPHASGGGNPYPREMREHFLAIFQSGGGGRLTWL